MPSESPIAHLTPDLPLAPVIRAWAVYLEDQGRSPNTIKAFTSDLRLLARFLPPDYPIGQISTQDLNRFLEWIEHGRPVPCSPKTLARRITALKSFFRWLHEKQVLSLNPAEKVIQRSAISPLPQVLTPAEKEAVLQAAQAYRQRPKPDARPYTLLALLLTTGIKKGECVNLHLTHVVEDDPQGPYIFVRYASPQHRYKERKIPVTQEWLAAYHEYLAQYAPTDRVFPWSARRLEYLLEEIGNAAGLDKHLSFAMCRWTCALEDWRSGVEPNKIRQKLGLSKIQWREVRLKLEQLDAQVPRDQGQATPAGS